MSEAMERNKSFYKARRQFDDARSFIHLAKRLDDNWDPNAIPALVRAASKEIDKASVWFYPEGGAS